MKMTSTFKHKKGDMVEQGYDLSKVEEGDKLFFYDSKAGKVQPLTEEIVKGIESGKVKL
jgi:hypothetical protein